LSVSFISLTGPYIIINFKIQESKKKICEILMMFNCHFFIANGEKNVIKGNVIKGVDIDGVFNHYI